MSTRLATERPHQGLPSGHEVPPGDCPWHQLEHRYEIPRRSGFAILIFAGVAANILLATGATVSWLSPIVGFLGVVAIPTQLTYLINVQGVQARSERLGTSLALTLLLLMLAGLGMNTLLPYVGVAKPLATVPVVLMADGLSLALGIMAFRRHPSPFRFNLPALGARDCGLLALGLGIVALAVMGAVRLNNGAGGGLTLFMLLLAMVALGLLLTWRDRLNPGVITVVIYCLSLALLLMTSLRGWYTTGHDIQREYHVFELTKARGVWDVSLFKDAYNACLSITILPTIISRWTRIADPYVYKVFFQILFALCPVLVYRLGARMATKQTALLGTIFFISFVTFFQDMPMLNRQELAFLFLVVGLLAAFNDRWPVRTRQIWFGIFAAGMVLSHYSTTYVTIGVLCFAWAVRVALGPTRKLLRRLAPRTAERVLPVTGQREKYVMGLGMIMLLAVLAYGWSTPLTHTERQLSLTIRDAINSIRGGPGAERDPAVAAYRLVGKNGTSAVRLAAYRKLSLQSTVPARASGEYVDAKFLSRFTTPVVAEEKLPATPLGRALNRLGLNVGAFNDSVRQSSAKILQILVVLGMFVILFARRRAFRPPPEFYFLAAATLCTVALQTALPVLLVNYGVERAFQQGLVILGVFLGAGSLAVLPVIRQRWRIVAAGALTLAFFASSTGIVTQATGGYRPQLHLNNAGTYYDVFYLHPEEVAGIEWLRAKNSGHTSGEVRSRIQADRYMFNKVRALTQLNVLDDIYPDLIRRDAYVFLGYSNVRNGTSTVSFAGDLIAYKYPMALLDDSKDLLYSSGGARVYR